MAYQKHDWNTGEVITANKLNNIENGIENNDNIIIIKFEIQQTESNSNIFQIVNDNDYLAEKYLQAKTAILDSKFVITEVDNIDSNLPRYLRFIKIQDDQSLLFSEFYPVFSNNTITGINYSEFILCDSNNETNNSSFKKAMKPFPW